MLLSSPCLPLPLPPPPQGAPAPLRSLPLLRASRSGRVCHVHFPRTRPAGQPPPLHHREAGLCKLGTYVWHPLLPAGLEPPTSACQPDAKGSRHGDTFGSGDGVPADVTRDVEGSKERLEIHIRTGGRGLEPLESRLRHEEQKMTWDLSRFCWNIFPVAPVETAGEEAVLPL